VLVNRAALCRDVRPQRCERLLQTGRAVDDQELGRLQPAGDEIVEQRPPGGLALAAHVAHGQQHLLAVAANAEDDQQRDRCRLLVQPDAHDGAVEDQPDDVVLAASGRFAQASQSVFTLRHTRLTVSLPIAPLNSAASARRTRRVLVPAR